MQNTETGGLKEKHMFLVAKISATNWTGKVFFLLFPRVFQVMGFFQVTMEDNLKF